MAEAPNSEAHSAAVLSERIARHSEQIAAIAADNATLLRDRDRAITATKTTLIVLGLFGVSTSAFVLWVHGRATAAEKAVSSVELRIEESTGEMVREMDTHARSAVDQHINRVREFGVIPIGGIIAWYGTPEDDADYPDGFELCDGTPPKHSDSQFRGNKPNLIGYYLRGDTVASDVPSGPESLHIALPEHQHSVPRHTHAIDQLWAAFGPELGRGQDRLGVNSPDLLGSLRRGSFTDTGYSYKFPNPDRLTASNVEPGLTYGGAAIQGSLGTQVETVTTHMTPASISIEPPTKRVIFLIRVR